VLQGVFVGSFSVCTSPVSPSLL